MNKVYEFKIGNKQLRILLNFEARTINFEYTPNYFCELSAFETPSEFTWLGEDLSEFDTFEEAVEYCEIRSEWGGCSVEVETLPHVFYEIKQPEVTTC